MSDLLEKWKIKKDPYGFTFIYERKLINMSLCIHKQANIH